MRVQKDLRRTLLRAACGLGALFLLVLLAVVWVDVQPIGPQGSSVGLAAVNGAVRDFFGVRMFWYEATELLGLLSLAVAGCFGLLGLVQLLRRRSLAKVDPDLLLLGGLYVLVLALYVLFEQLPINYRPIILETELEASFPSSHTMLVVCIMGGAICQAFFRLQRGGLRTLAVAAAAVVMGVTVVGRLVCGVHWCTDILAGLFLSGALVLAYAGLCLKPAK